MRFEFDATNPNELTAVFVAIAVLRGGDMSLPLLGDDDQGLPGTSDLVVPIVIPPAPVPAPPAAAVPAPPAAVVPPVPAPPAAAVPAPPAAPAGVDVDKAGLPWDGRIHSKPASKKKDGYWRQKRGVDEATVATVTAELLQAMAAPPAASVVPPPMFEESAPGVPLPPAGEAGPDAATVFGAGGAAAASEPPAPPAVAVPPAPPAPAAVDPLAAAVADGWLAHPESEGFYYRGQEVVATADLSARYGPPAETISFADLMRKITGLQTAGHLTVEGTQAIAVQLGITGVRDLMHRPDLISSFDALLPVAP